MVYVPFLNIELPEPKLRELLPDTVDLVVRGTARLKEAADLAINPFSPEEVEKYTAQLDASIPREFNRVIKRIEDGKVVDSEQLSSELEDASFDWYRRMLRTSVVGATEDGWDDIVAEKLGFGGPGAQQQVQQQFLAQQGLDRSIDAVLLKDAGGEGLVERLRMLALLDATHQQGLGQAQEFDDLQRSLQSLRGKVKPSGRQGAAVVRNASMGVVLGLLLVKGAVQLAKHLLKPKGKGKAKQPQPLQRRTQRPAPAPPPPAKPQPAPKSAPTPAPAPATRAAHASSSGASTATPSSSAPSLPARPGAGAGLPALPARAGKPALPARGGMSAGSTSESATTASASPAAGSSSSSGSTPSLPARPAAGIGMPALPVRPGMGASTSAGPSLPGRPGAGGPALPPRAGMGLAASASASGSQAQAAAAVAAAAQAAQQEQLKQQQKEEAAAEAAAAAARKRPVTKRR